MPGNEQGNEILTRRNLDYFESKLRDIASECNIEGVYFFGCLSYYDYKTGTNAVKTVFCGDKANLANVLTDCIGQISFSGEESEE